MSSNLTAVNYYPYRGSDATNKVENVHFFHANGFPVGVYEQFITTLTQDFAVHALHGRATWPNSQPPNSGKWDIYANDLIEYIEHLGKPIIAIGHSMGASSTVLAANKRPDLFKALVLIEPAMVNRPLGTLIKLLPKKVMAKTKLVKGTLGKPDTWDSVEDYLKYIKKFKNYQGFTDETFELFTQHAISKNTDGKQQLVFPKAWEAHNYTQPPYLMKHFAKLNKDKLNIPTLAIRGKSNLFFPNSLWSQWQKHQPAAVFRENLSHGHLFPLENAKACHDLVMEGLREMDVL